MTKRFIMSVLALLATLAMQAQETIKVGNATREMIVYAPKNLPKNQPLVITLHGFNQSASYQRDNTQWNNLADTAKIVVVYPQYQGGFWDTGGVRGSSNDIQFIETIIDEMYKRYGINRNRVYVSGFSLGSMMTYNIMEQLSDKIAACAPVSGVRFDNRAPKVNGRQVPFIHTHGTGDDVFKWGGDPGHAAGGYPAISEYVQKWATYYKCTDKKFTQPYPASKSGSKDALTLWKQPGSAVEVALLQLDGVGHWHSDAQAWGGISTTQEIWRFMKRFTLGPEPPQVKAVEPEHNSFDLLPDAHRTFTLTLDGDAEAANATAQITSGSKTVKLKNVTESNGRTLTFKVPDTATLPTGECTLTVSGISAAGGGMGASFTADYIYGITEVLDEEKIDTLIAPNWPSMQEELGQCIPYGWRLTFYNEESKLVSTTNSGTANLESGCRLMYFPEGGEFTAGFYLSARDQAKAMLAYGRNNNYRLSLSKGCYYDLSFRSTYWNKSARDNKATFNAELHKTTSTTNMFEALGVTPKGCLLESSTKKPKGTAAHHYSFKSTSTGGFSLDFTMTQGWDAVVVADVMLTTALSIPERYKGTLHRLLLEAAAICDSSDSPLLDTLREALDKYRDFASTSPSEYDKAIAAMRKALDTVPVGVAAPAATQGETRYYSVDGRRLPAPQRGITIERKGNTTRKVVRL